MRGARNLLSGLVTCCLSTATRRAGLNESELEPFRREGHGEVNAYGMVKVRTVYGFDSLGEAPFMGSIAWGKHRAISAEGAWGGQRIRHGQGEP